MDTNGLACVLRSRRHREFTFERQIVCVEPHQVALEVKRSPSDRVEPTPCDIQHAVKQRQFLCPFEHHLMQDLSCDEIHLHHRVFEADVAMSSLHFEVGRKCDGVEGRNLGVARRGEVNDPEARSFVDDAVVPIETAFVEHVELSLTEHRQGHAGQEKGEGCFHESKFFNKERERQAICCPHGISNCQIRRACQPLCSPGY